MGLGLCLITMGPFGPYTQGLMTSEHEPMPYIIGTMGLQHGGPLWLDSMGAPYGLTGRGLCFDGPLLYGMGPPLQWRLRPRVWRLT